MYIIHKKQPEAKTQKHKHSKILKHDPIGARPAREKAHARSDQGSSCTATEGVLPPATRRDGRPSWHRGRGRGDPAQSVAMLNGKEEVKYRVKVSRLGICRSQ